MERVAKLADFNILSFALNPHQTDAPLAVDPYQVLTSPIAGPRL
jgi:hypothetical protein